MLSEERLTDSEIRELIGESLKRCRKEFKQTQGEVAAALGTLQQTYYKNESGRAVPSALIIFKLAEHYNVSTDYLLGLTDEPRPLKTEPAKVVEQPAEKSLSLEERLSKLEATVAKLTG